MRVSRGQAEENRDRIVEVAGRLFREKGFDGIGVADLMKAAGLTHGGFYGHFASKDDLIAEASSRVMAASARKWTALAENAPDDPFGAIVASYLRHGHRDDPGTGCAMPTLAAETARHGAPVRRTFTEGLRLLLDVLAKVVQKRGKAAQRQAALAALSALVGAVVLARAVDDPALSDEILTATKSALGRATR